MKSFKQYLTEFTDEEIKSIETIKKEEEKILNSEDKDLYLDVMNNNPMINRSTKEELRNGLILYWNVYRVIKDNG